MITNKNNMEYTVNERVRIIISYLSISENKFSAAIGITQSVINTMFSRGTEPSAKIIKAIINTYPFISLDWLITGNGAMLKQECETPVKDIPPNETRPRVPYSASAGSLTSSVDGVSSMQCEQIPLITAFPSYDFTIQIKGDSMYPNYEGGDEVACKRIDSTSFIQWGKVHVLDTAQGIVIKRVYEDGDGIRCVSYNKEYPDFTIAKSEVYSMSLVVGMLRL